MTHLDSSIYIPLAVLLGLLVGSFLNVVIYRLPIMLEKQWQLAAKQHLNLPLTEQDQLPFTLSTPPSRCPRCGNSVKPWQNIPIISYLLLHGRCHSCRSPISCRYPAVELLTGILFGIVAWRYGYIYTTLGGLIFTAALVALCTLAPVAMARACPAVDPAVRSGRGGGTGMAGARAMGTDQAMDRLWPAQTIRSPAAVPCPAPPSQVLSDCLAPRWHAMA